MPLPLALPATTIRFDAADPRRRERALEDLRTGFRRWRLALALAWLDLRNRYRGSVLGPLWMTLSTAVMLGGLGVLYSALFKQELASYLPWLGTSLVIWTVLAQVMAEACLALTGAEGIIRQMSLPYTIHALRVVLRNMLVAAHNIPLIVIVFAVCGTWPGWEGLLVLPGMALVTLNAIAGTLFLGMLCARFRDIAPIVASVVQIAFFMTPVLWSPSLLHIDPDLLLLNPFFALMEVVRAPLLEGGGSRLTWVAALVYTGLNFALAFAFFVRFRARIAFWV
jgi:lipopolysaccharide transport system permease protein